MTHITLYMYSDEETYIGFRSEGHAEFDDVGKDIVCAALSVLTINTMNSIESLTNDKFVQRIDEDNAVMEFLVTSEVISNEANVLLKSMVLGLKMILESNPSHVSITIEEV